MAPKGPGGARYPVPPPLLSGKAVRSPCEARGKSGVNSLVYP